MIEIEISKFEDLLDRTTQKILGDPLGRGIDRDDLTMSRRDRFPLLAARQ